MSNTEISGLQSTRRETNHGQLTRGCRRTQGSAALPRSAIGAYTASSHRLRWPAPLSRNPLCGLPDMKTFALLFALAGLANSASAQALCGSDEISAEARQQCEDGRSDALQDMENGVPKWHWFGIVDHSTQVADSLLRERYGLHPVFHGDVVLDNEDHYADAYNTLIADRLAPRFGDDFVGRAFSDARALFPGQEVLNSEVLRDVPAPPGVCKQVERCIVFVQFHVSPRGEPVDVQIFRSPDAALNEAALAAASRARFRPASDVENGRSWGRYTVPIRFSLK